MKFLRIIFTCFAIFSFHTQVEAANLINDIEINTLVYKIVKIIKPNLKYNLLIIDSDIQNAFTTIDKNGNTIIAVYSGLIKSLKADEFVGVLCHEIGHIHHKHVVNFMYLIEQKMHGIKLLSALMSIPYVNVIALLLLSSEMNNIMLYSQQNEVDADLYAFNRLNELKWPVKGLVGLFEKWSYQEDKNYFSSHPWSSSRKEMAEKHIVVSDKLDEDITKAYDQVKSRIKKGLYEGRLPKYLPSNLYEKAWNEYLNKNYNTKLVDQILAKQEKNIQYYLVLFLKAKILAKQGNFQDAIYYMDEVWKNTKSSLVHFEKLKLSLRHSPINKKSLEEIECYKRQNPSDIRVWNLFAYYYAKQNNRGAFFYYKAEYVLAQYKIEKAKTYLKKAMKILPKHSPFYIKCTDIYNVIYKK